MSWPFNSTLEIVLQMSRKSEEHGYFWRVVSPEGVELLKSSKFCHYIPCKSMAFGYAEKHPELVVKDTTLEGIR